MWLLDLITVIPRAFNTVDNVTNAISNQKIAAIKATTDEERIAAEERVKTLEARRDVMVAEAGSTRVNAYVRAVLASIVIVVLAKLMAWDKVVGSLAGCSQAQKGTCGLFTTDPLDDNQWKVIMVVIGFYFLAEIGSAFARRR